jgi:hypothetical protein
MVSIMHILIICFLFIFILVALKYLGYLDIKEPFFDYDWTDKWSEYDKKARLSADCKPIYKVHRKMGQQSVWVWTVPESCEQGLPHTRGIDVIAIPENYPKEQLPPLMDHEYIHILQRLMPESWARFYRIKWFYNIYNSAPVGMPQELIELRRANPDTANEPYACWKSRWWPIAVYPSKTDLSLRKAYVKWWDQETGVVKKMPPEDWTAFFGVINQSEHPHEISAEYLSGPLRLGKKPNNMPPGMAALAAAWKTDAQFPVIS